MFRERLDFDGVSIDNETGEVLLTSTDDFSFAGAHGHQSDIIICNPTSLGK